MGNRFCRTPSDRQNKNTEERAAVFRGKIGVQSCTVRDITNLGAGVDAQDLQMVPLDFDLSFDGFRTGRSCQLMWRQGDFLGVVFAS
jgi:hypothetical protein